MVPDGFIATMIFAVGLWFFIMMFWGVACGFGLVKDFPKPKAKPSKVKPAIEPEPKQDSDWFGTWNDKPDDSWFDPEAKPEPQAQPEPEPQTDPKLIEEVISGLQHLGFKKKDAKAAVLRACEGRVFEDHQSLVEAALDKSNL